MAVEAAATPPPRPTVHDSQEDEKAIEESTEQRDKDSSSSHVPDNGSRILRNYPTHEDDVAVAVAADQEKHDAEAAVEAPAKPKPPSIIAKVMQKLRVNPVILKCIFKSVFPSSWPCHSTSGGSLLTSAVTLFSVEAPSHQSSPLPYTKLRP